MNKDHAEMFDAESANEHCETFGSTLFSPLNIMEAYALVGKGIANGRRSKILQLE